MRYLPLFFAATVVGLTTIACGSDRDRSAFDKAQSKDDAAGDLGGGDPSLGPGSESPDGKPEACAAEVTTANRAEVDIIVVIDTSGSMMEETNQVKQNLNAFAQSIGNTGLDYNVIMIAEKPKKLPFAPPGFSPPGICVTPPLAGADCANGPKFHHLDTAVGSFDSLQIILDKYPQYSAWLRPTAYKVFIEVTDDNSSLAFDAFDPQLLAKSAQQFGDATNRRYIFNSICGYKRNTPVLSTQKCGSAENTGDQYQHLSQLTGGTVDSVCETSYASVFDNIAKGLITKLGCEFSIPKAADGKATDPSTVVVTYTPGDGSAQKPLTQVTDASKCGANPDGWYYDDATTPTKILFCPSTCSTAGADTDGKLDVAIGCVAPPPK
ncbi:MAG: VWA domain-containing protein [Labilithrix sp.]|nr:VWA domain-containing protein [Labilithrix sp.]